MDLHIIETLVLILHVMVALAIIGLVLIQHGKGADMGSGFGGGASNTVFGSVGSGNFLTRLTSALAVTFFLTSFGLAYFAKEHSLEARDVGIPSVVNSASDKTAKTPADNAKGSSTSEIPQSAAPSGKGEGSKK